MSLEVTVVCDGCGTVMAGARTAAEARRDAKDAFGAKTGLPGGRDLCRECSEAS